MSDLLNVSPKESVEQTPSGSDDIHPAAKPLLFLGEEKAKRTFIWVALAGLILMIGLGLVFPAKYVAPFEKIGGAIIPGSWAIIGMLAFAVIVLATPALFGFLARSEDYYGEGGLPDPDERTERGEE